MMTDSLLEGEMSEAQGAVERIEGVQLPRRRCAEAAKAGPRGVVVMFEALQRPKLKTLSILIPVYNEERYLAAVVKRVVEQPSAGGLSAGNHHGQRRVEGQDLGHHAAVPGAVSGCEL